MTKEDWEMVRKTLELQYCEVELKIDDYNVTLRLERENAFKNVIVIYVDGKFKAEWLTKDCDIRSRFANKKTSSLYSKKDFMRGKKVTKKEEKIIENFLKENNKQFNYYTPYWTSFNSLKRHLIKNNENITLIEC